MLKPYFSIVIPVFNAEKNINRCLDSILAQSFTEFEIVLVNDGSLDQTAHICDAYAYRDSRIRVVHQCNQGVSVARNKGLKQCTGEFIIFIDSDDYITSDFFSAMRQYITDDVDIIVSEALRVLPDGSPANDIKRNFNYKVKKFDSTYVMESDQENNCVIGNAYRRDVIDGCCFDSAIRVGEDTIFHFTALQRANKVVFAPLYMYCYVISDDSTYNSSYTPKQFDEIYTWQRMCEMFSVYPQMYAWCKKNYCWVLTRLTFKISTTEYVYSNQMKDLLKLIIKNRYDLAMCDMSIRRKIELFVCVVKCIFLYLSKNGRSIVCLII